VVGRAIVRDRSPREAAERYLDRRRPEVKESTLSSIWYRLKLFVEWCEDQGIDSMADLSGWELDEYQLDRHATGAERLSLNKELGTLGRFLEYCETIDLVEPGLADAVDPPAVTTDELSDDTMLPPERAERVLAHYRKPPDDGTRTHAVFEVLWTVGCRASALVSLDVQDFDAASATLQFHDRQETGTSLKNGSDSERVVGLLDPTVDAIQTYVDQHQIEVRDEHGRQPLFTSEMGRPTTGTVRDWMYLATVPCHYTACPHDRDPETCDWLTYTSASHCPSSRSPHQIRTGSITWQRSRELPLDVVSGRVDSAPDTIEQYYDKEDPQREFEERRKQYLDRLDTDDSSTQ